MLYRIIATVWGLAIAGWCLVFASSVLTEGLLSLDNALSIILAAVIAPGFFGAGLLLILMPIVSGFFMGDRK